MANGLSIDFKVFKQGTKLVIDGFTAKHVDFCGEVQEKRELTERQVEKLKELEKLDIDDFRDAQLMERMQHVAFPGFPLHHLDLEERERIEREQPAGRHIP